MKRTNVAKDRAKQARRRARKIQRLQAIIRGALMQTTRVIPDKRNKPLKHKKPIGGYYEQCGED
jgi:hypothetical protein